VIRRLVVRPGAIGDFIVSLPAIESLCGTHRAGESACPTRTSFGFGGAGAFACPTPAISAEVWTASAHLPLLRSGARVRAIADTGLDLLGIVDPHPALVAYLNGFDDIVSWYGSNRPEFRALVESLGLPFRFFDALPPAQGAEHAVDFYLRQTGSPPGAMPCIPVPACERAGAVIHPFSGSPRKNWPIDRYRELAHRLADTMPVAWCAGPEDHLPEAEIRIADLYELACRLAGIRVFIGNDSGIAHLAAAVETPVVALFGPTDPLVWAPRGRDVRVVQAAEMAAIPVADVLAATLK
jgi:ADP-heptose:LPS heptosyltransferase